VSLAEPEKSAGLSDQLSGGMRSADDAMANRQPSATADCHDRRRRDVPSKRRFWNCYNSCAQVWSCDVVYFPRLAVVPRFNRCRMYAGSLVENGRREDFFNRSASYTQGLLEPFQLCERIAPALP